MRASALICLSAGAELVGADLEAVRRHHVARRSGGVVVAWTLPASPAHSASGTCSPRPLRQASSRSWGCARGHEVTADLARIEAVLDASRAASRIEPLLPVGVRSRQLSARTVLLGMLICQAEEHGTPRAASTRPWSCSTTGPRSLTSPGGENVPPGRGCARKGRARRRRPARCSTRWPTRSWKPRSKSPSSRRRRRWRSTGPPPRASPAATRSRPGAKDKLFFGQYLSLPPW